MAMTISATTMTPKMRYLLTIGAAAAGCDVGGASTVSRPPTGGTTEPGCSVASRRGAPQAEQYAASFVTEAPHSRQNGMA